jgi:hypothetical protein
MMYRKDDRFEPEPEKIWEERAVIIESEDPIICYGMTRFKYTSDGYLGLPTSSLGTKYIVASYQDPTQEQSPQYLTSYTSIVAAYDDTEVTFTLGGTTETYVPQDSSKKLLSGESMTKIMNKGDVWLIPARGNHADLSGSIIKSNKAVGVISGNYCAYVPLGNAACDYLIEYELPIESWGKKYNVPVIFNREYAPMVKIFASEPNTNIYRNDQLLGTISEVGGSPNVGYLHRRLWDKDIEGDNNPAEISGDNPINITLFNTGQTEDNIESDPFQMVISPIEQYSNKFLFSTPGYSGEGFADNYLAVVYRSEDGSIPDDILFGEMKYDEFETKNLNSMNTTAPKVFNENADEKYYLVTVTLKKDNIYGINSASPVMAYIYGYDYYDSYGYPAGAILKDLTIDDKMEPQLSSNSEDGKNYDVNINDLGGDDVISGLAYVGLMPGESMNYELDLNDFVPGDKEVNAKLTVKDDLNEARAVLYAIDKAGNIFTDEFVYKPTSVEEKVTIDGVTIEEIYPTPAIDEISIRVTSELSKNTSIKIVDLSGNTALNRNVYLIPV